MKNIVTPHVCAIPYQDPLRVFTTFANEIGSVFLDSAMQQPDYGRYSFIGIDPFLTISSYPDQKVDSFLLLKKELANFTLRAHTALPPFQGGAMGYFSYDLCQHLENITLPPLDLQFPEMIWGLYDLVIAFDHLEKLSWIFSSGLPEKNRGLREIRALERSQWLQKKLQKPFLPPDSRSQTPITISSNFTAASYYEAIKKIKEYILAGDIFQANLTQRYVAKLPADLSPFQLYCQLRAINPAPFASYLNFNNIIIASASPERFLKLTQDKIETRPIKGTQKRDKDPAVDQQLANKLLQSEKDRAENIMIVDLLRNDLSRIAKDHSVKVTKLCGLETYATVHHLVSVVNAQLKPNYTAVDLIKASFPGGSITGAPKVRAMQIISEIEPTRRGPYCGSAGYIGFDGNMDTSILIRSFVIKDNHVQFQTGGAITADSDPEQEYLETLTKAKALELALRSDTA